MSHITYLLETAEKLREDRDRVLKDIAYVAPELVTPNTRQWLSTTETLIDLFEAVAAHPEIPVFEHVTRVAQALTDDYSNPVE